MEEIKSEEISDIIYLAVKEDKAKIATEIIRIKQLNPLLSLDKAFIDKYIANYKKDMEQMKKVYNSLIDLKQIINDNENRNYLLEEIKKLQTL